MTSFSFADLFPSLHILNIIPTPGGLRIQATSTAQQACCPDCQHLSRRVHSRYSRAPRDLPCSGHTVALVLSVCRFRCLNPACARCTFVEPLPRFLPKYAQRTERLTASLRRLGCALGGAPAARLAQQLQLPSSRDTVLRIIRQTPATPPPTPRVLGVDDWALRKGRTYGTLLIDLERGQPVDLLPDRTAATLAQWLQQHPGIEIITRDRSTEYTRGATQGAPTALQIADRWHLIKNLREVLERILDRLRAQLQQRLAAGAGDSPQGPSTENTSTAPVQRSAGEEAIRMGRRLRRQARYEEVVQLHRSGVPILQIAKRLGMSRQTVRSYIATPAFPERAPHRRRGSILDDYEEYIQQRWAEGCHNALQLWREIRERGYNGGRKPVFSWVQRHRQEPAASTPKKYVRSRREGPSGTTPDEQRRNRHRLASSRQLVWVLLRERQDLDAEEGQLLEQLRGEAEVAQAYGLAQQFLCMGRQRDGAPFDGWLDACLNSPVKELQTFAAGLDQDYGAVSAALRSEWSNGPVEGHVNRLKLLKRQMYGRASFDLLKHRVLNVA